MTNSLLLLPTILLGLCLVLAIGLQGLRKPIIFVALSIFTIGLDYIGRLEGTLLTVNFFIKIVIFTVLFIWMAVSNMKLRVPRHLIWFLPFLTFSAISTLWSSDLQSAVFFIIRSCVIALYAVMLANFVRSRKDLLVVVLAMGATALFVSFFAHMQTLNLLTMNVVDVFQKTGPDATTIRALGTFLDSNALGQLLMSYSVFMIALLGVPRPGKLWRSFLLAALFVIFGAILLSFSRSTWLAMAMAATLFIRFRPMRPFIAAFSIVGLLGIAYLFVFTPYGLALVERIETLSKLGSDYSGQLRSYLNIAGLSVWMDKFNIIWGAGYRSFQTDIVNYWHPLMSHDMAYHSGTVMSHTLYITILAETGLIGLTLFGLFLRSIFRCLRDVFSRRPDGILACVTMAIWVLLTLKLVDFIFNPSIHDNQYWVAIGLLGAVDFISQRESAAQGPAPESKAV